MKTRVQDLPWQLYKTLLSVLPAGACYDQPADRIEAIRALIHENDPAFVARLAIYLREEMQFRSLSFVLTAELAARYGDPEWMGPLILRIVREAGEIPEWLDYYAHARNTAKANGFRIPGRLRKSLSVLFNRLDEYSFSRLSPEDQLKMRQALALVHPAGGKAQKILFGKILRDKVPARSTWASEWHQLQHQAYDSPALKGSILRDKWKEGISSFRIGYPALLENLRPILAAGVSGKVLKLAAEYIGNAAAITGSRSSPLRFLEAYRRLKGRSEGGVPLLLEALEQAARYNAGELEGFSPRDRVVIAMDVSNSMKQRISEGSCIQRYDIGPLLVLMLKSRNQPLVAGIIGNTWKPVELSAPGILSGVDPFHRREGEAGYATNGHLVIQDLLKKQQVADKVIIFTDCSLWDNRPFHQSAGTDLVRLWRQYREMAPQATLILFDLAGYGHLPLENPEEGVYLVAGWHERIFGVLDSLENKDAVTERINQIIL